MKKFISFALIAAMLVSGAAIGVSADAPATAVAPEQISAKAPVFTAYELPEGTNALIIGDSNARGYGLEAHTVPEGVEPTDGSFGALAMEAAGKTAAAYAISGSTAADLAELLTGEQAEAAAAAIAAVDTIVINIGGNDLLAPFFTMLAATDINVTSLGGEAVLGLMKSEVLAAMIGELQSSLGAVTESFAENISTVMTTIKTANPDVNVYFVSIPDIVGGFAPFFAPDSTAGQLVAALSGQIQAMNAVLEATGEPVLNVNNIEALFFQPDGIHYSDDTHQLIADALVELIEADEAAEAEAAAAAAKAAKKLKIMMLLIGR